MTKVEYAVQWAVNIANDDSHGYSQGTRWGPDYDCSSLIISAYQNAGIPVKDLGASRTCDMYNAFRKAGFRDITAQCSLRTGDGLIAGDVVLRPPSGGKGGHTEMVCSPGMLVGAHASETGGSYGTEGDQTGHEVDVRKYYNSSWVYALRYDGNDAFTGDSNSLNVLSYNYAMYGSVLNANISPDYTQIHNFIATLDRNSPDTDGKELVNVGVVGAILEVGQYYDRLHNVTDVYLSPKIEKQVKMCNDANIPFGFVTTMRSRNLQEANTEIRTLRIHAEKYIPSMGLWFVPDMTDKKDINDSIVEEYKRVFEKYGFKGKIGFYATRKQLESASWDKWKSDFLLLLVDHVDDISEIETILTPEFFMLNQK